MSISKDFARPFSPQQPGPDDAARLTLLYCQCAFAQLVPERTHRIFAAAFAAAPVAVLNVSDLCGATARGQEDVLALLKTVAPVKILACYPRAVRWLLHAAGIDGDATRFEIFNLRELSAETVLERLGLPVPPAASPPPVRRQAETPEGWIPWFPVIDGTRCRNCGLCLDFCMFGVYAAAADGQVRVCHPDHCKTNCPACARICPEAAIMFPKIAEAPINGADPEQTPESASSRMRLNLAQLLGEDPYAALAQRRRRPAGSLVDPAKLEQAESGPSTPAPVARSAPAAAPTERK